MKITNIKLEVPNTLILLNSNSDNDIIIISPIKLLHRVFSKEPIPCWDLWYIRNLGYLPNEIEQLKPIAEISIDSEDIQIIKPKLALNKIILYKIEDVLKIAAKPRAPVVSYC